jgi:hypothetical protein
MFKVECTSSVVHLLKFDHNWYYPSLYIYEVDMHRVHAYHDYICSTVAHTSHHLTNHTKNVKKHDG